MNIDTLTVADIANLSTQEILEAYNAKTGSNVKRFSTRQAGIARLTKALQDEAEISGGGQQDPDTNRPAETSSKAPKAKKAKKAKAPKAKKAKEDDSGARRGAFDLKPANTIKGHREGTKRAKIIALLSKGATVDECMKATGWDRKTALEGIRLLNSYVGYGLKEDDKGVIKLVS